MIRPAHNTSPRVPLGTAAYRNCECPQRARVFRASVARHLPPFALTPPQDPSANSPGASPTVTPPGETSLRACSGSSRARVAFQIRTRAESVSKFEPGLRGCAAADNEPPELVVGDQHAPANDRENPLGIHLGVQPCEIAEEKAAEYKRKSLIANGSPDKGWLKHAVYIGPVFFPEEESGP